MPSASTQILVSLAREKAVNQDQRPHAERDGYGDRAEMVEILIVVNASFAFRYSIARVKSSMENAHVRLQPSRRCVPSRPGRRDADIY
jgi:hypothetical protein